MKVALINPNWSFEGSIYFGCREPHLPLEFGYSSALLKREGHDVLIVDGQLDGLDPPSIQERVRAFGPDYSVVTTAPSYLFWRCAPPELRVPRDTVDLVRDDSGTLVVVGPHASTTPGPTLRKLDADVAVLGECEEVLARLVGTEKARWRGLDSVAYRDGDEVRIQGGPHASDMANLPALRWPDGTVARHHHHHHRFESPPMGPGAEMETSRGCPYRCTFCAKENFRNRYRRRPLDVVLDELDGLAAQGIEYVYFIDEIFLPNEDLLRALLERPVKFGVQTRIDLWSHGQLELLGRAGCVSVEAGVESITPEGREMLDKKSKLSTGEFSDRLVHARRFIPFVQANLIDARCDDPAEIEAWRDHLRTFGVWANDPVPLFPYPGSPDYRKLWGLPDDLAWERAHEHYLKLFDEFSDIQETRPSPLSELELSASHEG